MTKSLLLTVLLSLLTSIVARAEKRPFRVSDSVTINADLKVYRLTSDIYLYVSWEDVGSWGRVGSNGLILVDGAKAFLIDTPMSQRQTAELLGWIDRGLGVTLESFAAGHWHDDCVGGLAYLNELGVDSYAGRQTNQILGSKGLVQAKHSMADSTALRLGSFEIQCHYLGGGHSTDNIVIWIPSQGVLFGGCMLKDLSNDSLGNTADAAPLAEWLDTVGRVEAKFSKAEIVVPGHGAVGGREIFEHTRAVLSGNIK